MRDDLNFKLPPLAEGRAGVGGCCNTYQNSLFSICAETAPHLNPPPGRGRKRLTNNTFTIPTKMFSAYDSL